MRALAIASFLLLATPARADIGPKPVPCTVPTGCVTCTTKLGALADGGSECAAAALDAGLVLSDCTDSAGGGVSRYYCPSSTLAARSCGCGAAEGMSAVALLALFSLLRRRTPGAQATNAGRAS